MLIVLANNVCVYTQRMCLIVNKAGHTRRIQGEHTYEHTRSRIFAYLHAYMNIHKYTHANGHICVQKYSKKKGSCDTTLLKWQLDTILGSKFGPLSNEKKKNSFPWHTFQNDQRIVVIILRYICWGIVDTTTP